MPGVVCSFSETNKNTERYDFARNIVIKKQTCLHKHTLRMYISAMINCTKVVNNCEKNK